MVNSGNNVKSVLHQLKELQSLMERFENEIEIPQIEFDLSLQKVSRIYDELLQLKQVKSKTPSVNISDTKVDTYSEIKKAKDKPIPDEVLSTIQVKKETQPDFELEPSTPANNEEVSKLKATEFIHSVTVQSDNTSDAGTAPKTVAELLQELEIENDGSALGKSQAIGNLLTAMGLTDRFQYIKVLFHDNQNLFTDTLEKLNQMPSLNAAADFISSHFQWDVENELVIRFLHLVKRRFL
jgi:hypothetical protein